MTTTRTEPSLCRFCHAGCPITVELEGDRPVRVIGNPNSPTYDGFLCRRGRALPEQLANPDRLLHSLKRQADGSYAPIPVEQSMDEIAARITEIIGEHGPRSVALYLGTYSAPYPASGVMAGGWLAMLGSPMMFTSNTIDQPGKEVANAMLGQWRAGPDAFADSDVWMVVGSNPVVTMAGGIPSQNPGKRLKDRLAAGMKLIVIDPRRTQTAARAQIHLAARPGEDVALLAAMLNVILTEGRHDAEFAQRHVQGLEDLRAAVAPFTPAMAAARADVPEEQIVEAAHTFADAERGLTVGITGANMSGHSSLVEYLMLCLNTVCGRFLREGDTVANPGVTLPRATPRAEAVAPRPYRGVGEEVRARGLAQSAAGMPTAALADEILTEGEGKVRVLISSGGNPVAAWPDQRRTGAAMEELDLLVQVDIKMSATAAMADYVIAPKISFEVPALSYASESIEAQSVHWGLAEPFGMYAPALIDTPPGSDLIEEWELFYGLAQRMGVPLFATGLPSTTATEREDRRLEPLDMENKPTTDELYALLMSGSRISLDEIKAHPDGARFDEDIAVAPADPDATGRLDVGNADMLSELAEVAAEPLDDATDPAFPFRLISRRLAYVYNSSGRDLPSLTPDRGAYNPAFLHPDDLADLGLEPGDGVMLASAHGEIAAIVADDATLRRGLVSMTHAFGPAPGQETDPRRDGTSTARLISVEDGYDPISGIPRMSGVPVRVTPG
ncbi:MAG: molybdopterin-containing oxidoreductase family protein [Iamia sp.]